MPPRPRSLRLCRARAGRGRASGSPGACVRHTRTRTHRSHPRRTRQIALTTSQRHPENVNSTDVERRIELIVLERASQMIVPLSTPTRWFKDKALSIHLPLGGGEGPRGYPCGGEMGSPSPPQAPIFWYFSRQIFYLFSWEHGVLAAMLSRLATSFRRC